MIRIERPGAPDVLRERAEAATNRLREVHAADPDGVASGTTRLPFEAALYGHAEVKKALVAAQNGKCAYCESEVESVAYGDVEHFRPKAGWKQADGDPLARPGYFWLTYEWDNLLFACERCNREYKRNLFPLEDPESRASFATEDHGDERPLFIDPSREDPQAHIGFRQWDAFARDASRRGRTTIDGLGLNRPRLLDERRRAWKALRQMLEALATLSKRPDDPEALRLIEELAAELEAAVQPSAPFTAMARCALRDLAP